MHSAIPVFVQAVVWMCMVGLVVCASQRASETTAERETPNTASECLNNSNIESTDRILSKNRKSRNKRYKFAPQFYKTQSELEYFSDSSGESIKRRCSAKNGYPKVAVRWYKDDHLINQTDSSQNVYVNKRGTLNINQLSYTDQGHYKCVLSNECGTIEWTFFQEVMVEVDPKVPPYLYSEPKNRTVTEGSNVTFACDYYSGPPATILWKHYYQVNGSWTDEDGEDYVRLLKKDYNEPKVQKIAHVTVDDAGLYECFLWNEYGINKHIQALTVLPKPEILELELPDNTRLIKHVVIPIIVIVSLVALALLGLCIYCYNKKKKRPTAKENAFNPLYPLILPSDMQIIPYDMRWEMTRENLDIGEVIGEGFFGKVYKGYALGLFNRLEPVIVAVKTLKDNATVRELDTLVQEMNTMKTIGDHVNIINFLGCCTQDGPLYILVEYAPYGNLRDFLQSQKPPDSGETKCTYVKPRVFTSDLSLKPLTCKDLISFSWQISRGMDYLSSRNIIHRDLAARNILVAEGYVLKIADFGLTRELREQEYYTKQSETPLPIKWMAIECLRDKKFLPKSDVWSFGVLLWEIFTFGSNPYPGLELSHPDSLYRWLAQGNRMDRPKHSPCEMYSLMLKCWREEISERPSFTQLVKNLDAMLLGSTGKEYLDLSQDLDYCQPYFPSECPYMDPATPLNMDLPQTNIDDSVFGDDLNHNRRDTKHSHRSDYSSLSASSVGGSTVSQPALDSLHSSGNPSVDSGHLESHGPVPSAGSHSPGARARSLLEISMRALDHKKYLRGFPYSTGMFSSDSDLTYEPTNQRRSSDGCQSDGMASVEDEYSDNDREEQHDKLLGSHNSGDSALVTCGHTREQFNTELCKVPSIDSDVYLLDECRDMVGNIAFPNVYMTKSSDKVECVELCMQARSVYV